MTTFSEVRFFKWQDNDKSVSLRAKSGSYGGGFRSVGSFGDTCGALCADDYKGINSQYVGQGKLVMTDEYIVGNGQVAQLRLQEKARTLDCMHEQQILLQRMRGGQLNAAQRSKVLQILWKAYGKKAVLKWGIRVLAILQSKGVLQPRVFKSKLSVKTQRKQKMVYDTPICPSVVAEWMLRALREQQKCGCSPQGRGSYEQQFEQSSKIMPELSQQNPQTAQEMFDMWEKGEGIGLLQQALYQIQKIRKSLLDEWKGGDLMGADSQWLVRRLTPL